MDPAARKTLEGMGRGLGVSAEELGRIQRERRIQRMRFAIYSLIIFVASFIFGAAFSVSLPPNTSSYPYAAALPLLGISSARRRANILGWVMISVVAFIWGFLMMQWQSPTPQIQENPTLYSVFGR
jgi:vacuolar-type H+-ATPase subunit I/STV1